MADTVATTSYTYDDAGRLDMLRHWEGTDTDKATGKILAGYDYDWDKQNRLEKMDFVNGDTGYNYSSSVSGSNYGTEDIFQYIYDERGQLTSVDYKDSGIATTNYAYDENGNRTDSGFESGPDNRLITDGSDTFTYDEEGNITRRTHSDGSYTEFTWDHRNRMITATGYDDQDVEQVRIEYSYDAGDNLIHRLRFNSGSSTAAESTIFVHEMGQLVFELEDTGNADLTRDDLQHRYLWGPGVNQLIADEAITDLYDETQNTTRWGLTDHLGTVRDWIDDDVNLLDHAIYDEYGNRSDTPTLESSIAWTGTYRDPHTGLQLHGKRWYNPEITRWMSQDWIKDGTNWHAYVGNSPTVFTDPSGLAPPKKGEPGYKLHDYTMRVEEDMDRSHLNMFFNPFSEAWFPRMAVAYTWYGLTDAAPKSISHGHEEMRVAARQAALESDNACTAAAFGAIEGALNVSETFAQGTNRIAQGSVILVVPGAKQLAASTTVRYTLTGVGAYAVGNEIAENGITPTTAADSILLSTAVGYEGSRSLQLRRQVGALKEFGVLSRSDRQAFMRGEMVYFERPDASAGAIDGFVQIRDGRLTSIVFSMRGRNCMGGNLLPWDSKPTDGTGAILMLGQRRLSNNLAHTFKLN